MELATLDEFGEGDSKKHWRSVVAVAGYVLLFRGRTCSKSVSLTAKERHVPRA